MGQRNFLFGSVLGALFTVLLCVVTITPAVVNISNNLHIRSIERQA